MYKYNIYKYTNKMRYLQHSFEYLIELAWLPLSLNQMCLLVTLNHNNQVEISIRTFHTRKQKEG